MLRRRPKGMILLSRRRRFRPAHRRSAASFLSPVRPFRSSKTADAMRRRRARHRRMGGRARDPPCVLHCLSKETAIRGSSMNRLLLTLAITITVGSLLSSNPAAAQLLPPAKRAERVEITKAPELELATDHLTIIRWTTNNPGGSDVHYGIVHYGTDPED